MPNVIIIGNGRIILIIILLIIKLQRLSQGIYPLLSLIGTIYYFGHFLIVLPVLGLVETPKKLPASLRPGLPREPAGRWSAPEQRARAVPQAALR